MVKCKIRGCDKKVKAKGYCLAHYQRLRRGRTLEPKCLWCKKKLPAGRYKFCNIRHTMKYFYHNNEEYRKKSIKRVKENYTDICFMGIVSKIYTNGFTKEIKESNFVKKEKDRILKDCIAHPKRYLKES